MLLELGFKMQTYLATQSTVGFFFCSCRWRFFVVWSDACFSLRFCFYIRQRRTPSSHNFFGSAELNRKQIKAETDIAILTSFGSNTRRAHIHTYLHTHTRTHTNARARLSSVNECGTETQHRFSTRVTQKLETFSVRVPPGKKKMGTRTGVRKFSVLIISLLGAHLINVSELLCMT